MTAKCDYCDSPATWHAAWQTPTMSAPTVAYACDEHRFQGMTPLESPIETERLPDVADREEDT